MPWAAEELVLPVEVRRHHSHAGYVRIHAPWFALNLVVKPTLDAVFKEAFVDRASANGDGLTAALLQDSRLDTSRSQAWSSALARYAIAHNAANREVITGWAANWQPLADRAVDGLAGLFADAPQPADTDTVRSRVRASLAKFGATWAD